MWDFDELEEVEAQKDQPVEIKDVTSHSHSTETSARNDQEGEVKKLASRNDSTIVNAKAKSKSKSKSKAKPTAKPKAKSASEEAGKMIVPSKESNKSHELRDMPKAAASARVAAASTTPAVTSSESTPAEVSERSTKAVPSVVRAQFLTMGVGLVEELELSKHVTAIEVKGRLAERLKIPAAEQRLLAGTAVWKDASSLETACQAMDSENPDMVQITVVRVPIATRVALSGSRPGILRVWDIENGSLLQSLSGHQGAINCVALHWPSQSALSGGEDRDLRRWDLAQGVVTKEFKGHTDTVNCLAASWSNDYAVSGSSDNSLRVWDLKTGKCSSKLDYHTGPVTCVALDEAGWKAVSGSMDRSVLIWDLSTGSVVQECHGHVSEVHCVSVDEGCRNAASGGWGTLKLWQLDTRETSFRSVVKRYKHGTDGFNISDLKGHIGPVTCVAIDWQSRKGLTGSDDNTLCIWGSDRRTTLGFRLQPVVLHRHTVPITCLAVDWAAACAVSGAWDCLWVWDLNEKKAARALRGPEERGQVLCVAVDKL